MFPILIPCFIGTLGSASAAALVLSGNRCGTAFCAEYQYCSNVDTHCRDCSEICNDTSHNFEEKVCVQQCQNYLHDIRYARSSQNSDDLLMEIKQTQVKILILLIILLVLFLSFIAYKIGKWLKRKGFFSMRLVNKLKKSSSCNNVVAATHENPNTQSPKMNVRKNGGSTSVFSAATGIDTVNTVSTPISRRHPAEDSTLDYSYDNQALAITPVTERPRTETTF